MKKSLLTAFVILFGAIGLKAQNTDDKTKEIQLDFKTKEISLEQVKNLKQGDLYRVKISKINMNLYNVQINHKDSIVTSTVNFPSLEMIGIESLLKIVNSIKSTTSATITTSNNEPLAIIENIESKRNERIEAQKEISKLKESKSLFNEIILLNKLNSQESKMNQEEILAQEKQIDLINSKVFGLEEELITLENELKTLEIELTAQLKKLEKENLRLTLIINSTNLLNTLKESTSSLDLILSNTNSNIGSLNARSVSYLRSHHAEENNEPQIDLWIFFKTVHSSILKNRNEITAISSTIGNLNLKFTEILKKNKELFEKDSTLNLLKSNFEKNHSEIKSKIDESLEKTKEEKINNFIEKIIHLDNNKERNYTSLPFQHNGSISKLEIIITPKNLEHGPVYNAEYQFPKSRGIVGIGGAFYYGFGFRNDMYSVAEIETSDSTSHFNIVKEDEQKGEIGFATLLHFVYRPSSKHQWFGLNGVIGPAISIGAQPQIRLTLGGGLAFGSTRNMLSVNALWMSGYKQQLSNVFQEGVDYGKKPEQVTVSRLSNSFGISIGYIYKF